MIDFKRFESNKTICCLYSLFVYYIKLKQLKERKKAARSSKTITIERKNEMKATRHWLADHIEQKFRKLRPGFMGLFRHYDLEDTTADPGNTGLCLTYISTGFRELLSAEEELRFKNLLVEDEGEGGPGDDEDFEILQQNNEVLVIVNENR